jgi:Amt family ammonium transporter
MRTLQQVTSQLDTVWVIVTGVLVMFMQAGFACVEMGFSRGKNAGTVVAKILMNFSVASLTWWACGFALAFGGGAAFVGDSGFFLEHGTVLNAGSPIPGPLTGAGSGYVFFQCVFCAVSLSIVWGTTLERIRFVAYPIYAVVFAGVIYPLVAHWIFGGGLLDKIGPGMQDFAGSTVVHLTGATGGLAALLVLGPREGKYGPDGRPRAIPGHSMPLFGLGVLILWLGWFGFNPGSTLGTGGNRFAEVVIVTNLAAAAGVVGAALAATTLTKSLDVGMIGNGAIAALVAITAPSGFVEFWAAPIIGVVAGVLVVVSVLVIDRRLDDPVGALSAHGVAGVWGTLSCGLFASPRLVAGARGIGDPGLFYSGSFTQLGVQALGVTIAFVVVFTLSYVTFSLIKATFGLRVTAEEEEAGLDIIEHGMYGYPEQYVDSYDLEPAGS